MKLILLTNYRKAFMDYLINICNTWLCMQFGCLSHSCCKAINLRTRGICTLSRIENPVATYIVFKKKMKHLSIITNCPKFFY